MANSMDGVSDENSFSLHFNEFVALLCQIGCQLYRGDSVDEIVRKLGLRMGLSDPINLRNHLVWLGCSTLSSCSSAHRQSSAGRMQASGHGRVMNRCNRSAARGMFEYDGQMPMSGC
eukprot:759124-Hanusia_phi.AAC.3